MTYHTLMTSPEIPWHNPENVTVPPPDGWRLITTDEFTEWSFARTEIISWADEQWNLNDISDNGTDWAAKKREDWSYITNRPLPSKYAHLLEPDYFCPKYRASVDAAREAGLKIEQKYIGMSRSLDSSWSPLSGQYLWNSEWIYRIAPQQPAKDPATDTDAHVEVIFHRGGWDIVLVRDEMSVEGVFQSLEGGIQVRIAPKPEPVRVPLSDYRVSEALMVFGRTSVIEAISDEGKVCCDDGSWFTPQHLVNNGAQIHRNGSWQPCFRIEEGGK